MEFPLIPFYGGFPMLEFHIKPLESQTDPHNFNAWEFIPCNSLKTNKYNTFCNFELLNWHKIKPGDENSIKSKSRLLFPLWTNLNPFFFFRDRMSRSCCHPGSGIDQILSFFRKKGSGFIKPTGVQSHSTGKS